VRAAVLVIAALGCVTCAAGGEPEWPTYHGDYSLRGVATADLGSTLKRVWRVRVGENVSVPVVAGGERLYVLHDESVATALSLEGKKLWSCKLGFSTDAPIAYAQGKILAAGSEGRLVALDAATGGVLWRGEIGDGVMGTPNVMSAGQGEKSVVFVMAQSEGVVHAFDLATGRQRWVAEATTRCDGHMSVGKDKLVFGNCDAGVQVLSADGRKGEFVAVGDGAEMAGGTAVMKGRVYAGNRSGEMVCVDLATSSVVWRYDKSEGEMFTTPAVSGNRVVFCSGECIVHCLDSETGTAVWTYETQGSQPHSPAIAGDKVVGAVDGTVFLLRLKDGKKLWSKQVADEVAGPSVAYGKVIVGTGDGHVIAFDKGGATDGK